MPLHELVFLIEEPASPQGSIDLEDETWIDQLTDQLLEAGALSVSVEDPLAQQPEVERPLFGEPGAPIQMRAWPVCRVAVHLEAAEDPAAWWQALSIGLPSTTRCSMEVRLLEDQDWVSHTQRQFEPIEVGLPGVPARLWVGPSWTTMPPEFSRPPQLGLVIDPGMAFGTGGHATTQLCLQALLRACQWSCPESLLDMGTGSGILALAAIHLGMRRVVGVDLDPVAIEVARANWQSNPLRHAVDKGADPVGAALDEGPHPASPQFLHASQPPEGQFDLVVANILAQPLRLLAPLLWSRVRPGGGLVLSGILDRQADELIECYAAAAPDRPRLQGLAVREGWVCLAHLPNRF